MSNIAAQAGVSKGTLYNYFVSKEALFAAYIEASCNTRMARLFEGVAETDHIRDGLYLLAQRGLTMMMAEESVELYRLIVSIALEEGRPRDRSSPLIATISGDAVKSI